jgi:S1-C subfamily serine protease
VLFGPITIRDALEISAQGLMVHHVEAGSIGEAQEIEKSDLLEAVDGVPVLEVDDLHSRLNEARTQRRRVTLTFKKLAGGDTLFSYSQRNLLVGELRIIGPPGVTGE